MVKAVNKELDMLFSGDLQGLFFVCLVVVVVFLIINSVRQLHWSPGRKIKA